MCDGVTGEEFRQIEQWLAQARGGCRDSLGKALNACRRYLLAIAGDELAPEFRPKVGLSDLVQDTFLEAQRDFARFGGKSQAELLAWLRQLLVHNVEDIIRKFREADKRLLDREVSLDHDRGCTGRLLDPAPSPSGQAIRKEEEQALETCLERLPENYRQAIVWHHRDGYSYAEIGVLLGITAEAARKLYQRAIALLTQQMNDPSGKDAP